MPTEIDPITFRKVLGNYPTGVTVVTALDGDGRPAAMVIGSFTSVSLDPPLVAYLPAKASGTYGRLKTGSSFCVNILGSDQERLSRIVASKSEDPFAAAAWRSSTTGAPVFDCSLAWIECETDKVIDAGDHDIVIGKVLDLDCGPGGLPLVFFRGGFGRFSPFSVVVPSQSDIAAPIRLAEVARAAMESLATDLGTEVTANAAVDRHIVTIASAGSTAGGMSSLVGLRTPLVPPAGSVYVAWAAESVRRRWLSSLDGADSGELEFLEEGLERVRRRGWAISLRTGEMGRLEKLHRDIARTGLTAEAEEQVRTVIRHSAPNYNPELDPDTEYSLGLVNAPVFGPDGDVVLTFRTRGEPGALFSGEQLHARAERMLTAADQVTSDIGGQAPPRA